MARRRGLRLGLPQTRLKERIVVAASARDDLAVDERDVQTLMENIFELRIDVKAIRRILEEDDEEEEDPEEDA